MVDLTRRDLLLAAGAVGGAAAVAGCAPGASSAPAAAPVRHRRIATEEAVVVPEQVDAIRRLVEADPGNTYHDYRLWRMITGVQPSSVDYLGLLSDIEGPRLAEMDRLGVDMQVIACTAPGVQMLPAGEALAVARAANDRFAGLIARHPTRFAALATVAPQDPAGTVKEMERAIRDLHLNGFMINSHTNDRYLDEEQFWPILEAAEALDRPIYIHPRTPSQGLVEPYKVYNMQSALWGYGAEVGLHAVRIMMSGVLDRFPKLRIVIGHMGEGIPFWLWRLDYMSGAARTAPLKPSEYFKRNFAITTSGQEFVPALKYSIEVLGAENVLWAIDYPYQPMEPAVAFLDGADISEQDKALVYHGNAERIFHIAPLEAAPA